MTLRSPDDPRSDLARTYDALAPHYDDLNGINDWLTAPVVLQRCPAHASSALEIGCGVGRVTRRLAARGLDVLGVDLSPGMIARAEAHSDPAAPGARFLSGDILGIDFADRRFDYVYGIFIAPYFDVPTLVRRMADLTAPGGRVALLGSRRLPSGETVVQRIGRFGRSLRLLASLNRLDPLFSLPEFVATVGHRRRFYRSPQWKATSAWHAAARRRRPWEDDLRDGLPGSRIESIGPELLCATWDKPENDDSSPGEVDRRGHE